MRVIVRVILQALVILGMLFLSPIESASQTVTCSHPDGHCPEPLSQKELADIKASNDIKVIPAVTPTKEHNFFNWKNSTVFGIQAGGAVWYAKERNGALSNVTNLQYWQRTQYLKNTYLTATFFALAVDGGAYAIHKSGPGKKRHLVEHLMVDGGAVALYLFAVRNLHEYNTQECRFGEKEFCH